MHPEFSCECLLEEEKTAWEWDWFWEGNWERGEEINREEKGKERRVSHASECLLSQCLICLCGRRGGGKGESNDTWTWL